MSLNWNLYLPQKQNSKFSAGRKKAYIQVEVDGESLRIAIPLALARRLQSIQQDGARQFVSFAELKEYIGVLERQCATSKIEYLISRRDYTKSELEQKLRLDGYSDDVILEKLKRAQECGLLDDTRFYRLYIDQKKSQGWGPRKIAYSLKSRGISTDSIKGWPEKYFDPSVEYECAYETASNKFSHVASKVTYEKILRFLLTRGFTASVANAVAKELS